MSKERFNENNTPGDPYAVDGALLNKIGRMANAESFGSHGGGGDHSYKGHIHQNISPPPFIFGIAEIVEADNSGDRNTAPDVPQDAPHKSSNLYLARFRWYDHADNTWKVYTEDVRLDAGAYFERTDTQASFTPSSGAGYGAIPKYVVGDNVPAYWDDERGWLVPVQSVPQETPRAVFRANNPEDLPEANLTFAQQENTVQFFLQTLKPGNALWFTQGQVSFAIGDGDWKDSRMGQAFFAVEHGTQVRLQMVAVDCDDTIVCEYSTLTMYGCGRLSSNQSGRTKQWTTTGLESPPVGSESRLWQAGGFLADFELNGLFADKPRFDGSDLHDKGTAQVLFEDSSEQWVIGCEFWVQIRNSSAPTAHSSSSTSSVSESSSLSASSFSRSESSISDESNSSSSQSVSSISLSSQSASSLSESSFPIEEYCCCTVVTNVKCNTDGTVAEVCYALICFPKIDGVPCGEGPGTACGEEVCVPCNDIADSESSWSSASTSESSISYDCPDWELDVALYGGGTDDVSPITVDVVVPLDALSEAHWDEVILDNALDIKILDDGGAGGTFEVNENTGHVTYTPPGDGSEAGQTFNVTLLVCDEADEESLSASSYSESSMSFSSSSMSTSQSSPSSTSVSSYSSSWSSLSVLSTSSSSLSTSSQSQSSLSSSSLSSSSQSFSSSSWSSLSSSSSSDSSRSESSSSSPADDACPECDACYDQAEDCLIDVNIADLKHGPGLDHNDFTNDPSIEVEFGTDVLVEIYAKDGATILPTVEETITVTSTAQFAEDLRALLTTSVGGFWTVTASPQGAGAVITDIVGVNASYQITEIVFSQGSGASLVVSEHSFDSIDGYQDLAVEASIALLLASITVDGHLDPCYWEAIVDLAGDVGTATFQLYIYGDPEAEDPGWLIWLVVEIRDDEDELCVHMEYEYTTAPAYTDGYQCANRYDLVHIPSADFIKPGPHHDDTPEFHILRNVVADLSSTSGSMNQTEDYEQPI